MKVLLDENLPHDLRHLLAPPHDVVTVAYLGWSGMKNGVLMRRAADGGSHLIEYAVTHIGRLTRSSLPANAFSASIAL